MEGRMHAVLKEILATTDETNPYMGKGRAQQLREELETLDIKTEPGRTLKTLVQLGKEEVGLGDLESGITHLKKAFEYLSVLNVPVSIRQEINASLGNAYIRLAETENCCASYSPESCIVPLQGAAIHTKTEGSINAIKHYHLAMKEDGGDLPLKLKCAWLTNIAYMTLNKYPQGVPSGIRVPPKAFTTSIPFPRFPNISAELGLDHDSLAGGAVMDDFDGDNDLDLITSCWDPSQSMRYYENTGNGVFRERSEAAGLTDLLGGLNLVQADYDNDGDIDLYVLRGAWLAENGQHPNSLLQNQGNGVFRDVTFAAGLGDFRFPSQSAAWADYDNDGDLDLYVGNETTASFSVASQLLQNRGDGTFTDVAVEAGVTNNAFAKGVVWGDIDADRLPDLIVSNLGGANRLYKNLGNGRFEDIAPTAGVEAPSLSFPCWTWDFDNDGLLDIYISPYSGKSGDFMQYYMGKLSDNVELPGHYRGDGKGGFANVAEPHGLAQPMIPMGANIGDLNNDGYLDFYLGTGEPNVSVILPNMMFLNQDGERFVDVTMAGGFGHLQKGHAIVFADYDEDGDQDVFEQLGGAQLVDTYRDALFANPGFGGHWLKVRLVGKTSNRSAIGARIHARFTDNGNTRNVYRFIGSGASFGANPLREHIGLGKAEMVTRLEIYWPTSDSRQVFENVPINQSIEIIEAEKSYTEIHGP